MTSDKKAVSFESALTLVAAGAVTGAVIESLGGKQWAIILRGRQDYVLKSERQSPRRFAALETALGEVKKLGLRRAEIQFERWEPAQKAIS